MSWKQWVLPEDREEIREEKNYSLLSDIFIHSSVNDYRAIRFVYNFPIGIFIGYALHYIAWHRLNFGDFDPIFSLCFQWSIIIGSGAAFAYSPVFRCATICVCLGGLSKSGQGILTLFVIEQLNQGPISNILSNFEATSQIVVCHLELQGELTKQKLTLLAGPAEVLFEKHFKKAEEVGKEMLYKIKDVIDPFFDQVSEKNDEDDELHSIISGEKAMAERVRMLDNPGQTVEPPHSSTSNLGKNGSLAMLNKYRMAERCQSTYALAVRNCKERFSDVQSKCYDSLPIVGLLVCWQYNSDSFCRPDTMEEIAMKTCDKFQNQESSDIDMDEQMKKMRNVTDQMEEELRVNLHFKAIEEPRTERLFALSEITVDLRNSLDIIKVTSETLRELFSAFMIFLVYLIFSGAVEMIRKYLGDIDFQNHFLTQYFWRIDHKRKVQGDVFLGKIRRSERKIYKLQRPLGLPSLMELKQAWKPLLQFVVLLFVVVVIVTFDHVFYRLLVLIIDFIESEAEQTGRHEVEVKVVGNGSIASIVRDLIEFNYTGTQHREVNNKVCLVQPRKSDEMEQFLRLFFPLLVMFFLQILLNYVVKRLTLFYVLGYIFRERSKKRIIYLYNKVITQRFNDQRLAKARLKYLVKNEIYTPTKNEKPFCPLLKPLYKLKKVRCELCQGKFWRNKMENCEDCETYYCLDCLESLKWKCLVCKTRRKCRIEA
ncbi:unnamed protein product [Bursaphelenchus xylophilus]|uniref:(pine wood nematode) hypothetical protein n=1 Tax=Bursaphelenchus xylophilus TaxID=6326 RepID=A0A1I7RNL8_BURXY|nr:unnamed protein product [Bursaphelenchus xylophilus]CAG9124148.1 unnamed protein product [Bursaphelenchus xylophilus]